MGNKNKEGGELGNTKNVLWSKWSHEIVFITHAALIKKKIWANVNNQQRNNNETFSVTSQHCRVSCPALHNIQVNLGLNTTRQWMFNLLTLSQCQFDFCNRDQQQTDFMIWFRTAQYTYSYSISIKKEHKNQRDLASTTNMALVAAGIFWKSKHCDKWKICKKHSFSADPDPTVFLNTDPHRNPASFSMRIRIQPIKLPYKEFSVVE